MRKVIHKDTVRWDINGQERGYGYVQNDGRLFLVKCPKIDCGLSNYAPNVLRGICTWCGFDANKEEPK